MTTAVEQIRAYADGLCREWRDLTWDQVQQRYPVELQRKEALFNERYLAVFSKSARPGLFDECVQIRCKREPDTTVDNLNDYGQSDLIVALRARIRELELELERHQANQESPLNPVNPSNQQPPEPNNHVTRRKAQCCILLIVLGVLVATVLPIIIHISQ